ncbi:MAG: DUF1844 domain-containing protein [Planctomycetota bacterium]|nr:DUF1844 domain-containing protein [Planctomycetota bacterium]
MKRGDDEDEGTGGRSPARPRTASDVPLPGGDFRLFVTRLSFQAMLSLGLIENPLTGTKQVNASSARMLVDDLRMLLEKTRGNLEPDEEAYLEKITDDLATHYERIVGSGDED